MCNASGRPVTIAEVALDAGVSIPTVSRVINDSAAVAEETRRIVVNSIERLGYHPNPMARGLSLGRSDTVLVILPHLTEPSVTMRLVGLIGVLRSTKYELHLVDLEQPPQERTHSLGEIVAMNRPAGVVIISLDPDDADRRRFRDGGTPVVLVDVAADDLPADAIDDVAGGMMATQHLLSLGHRKIAFVGDHEPTAVGVPASANRRHGYEAALREAGVPIVPEYIRTAPHGQATAEALGDELMSLDPRPTAVFAASDIQAFGVMAAARRAGLNIPGDLSVVGFDDVFVAGLVGLTTVRQPLEIFGVRAGLRLLELLGHPVDHPIPELPPLEMIVRETTAPVAPATAKRSPSASSKDGADVVKEVSNALSAAPRQSQ
jgi:LacI family transcriptional regulator